MKSLFKFHLKIMDRIKSSSLSYLVFSKFLIILVIGSYFSIELVKYGYFILLVGVLVVFHSALSGFLDYKEHIFTKYYKRLINFIGVALLVLYFGIQSPQIPFKIVFLVIGLLLMIPAIRDLFGRGKD
jgi:hypothetical protein